jgi:hypothetical protein
MKGRALATTLAIAIAPSIARANDSTAVLGAGGLVLTKSADVSMESEDLEISDALVRVSYVFKNDGPADVTTEVAFPVPGIPICDDDHSDECLGKSAAIVPGDNPMRFKLFVEGKPTAFQTEDREELKGGVGFRWVTHHWRQVFPKGRSISIAHEYAPARGGSYIGYVADSEALRKELAETYCVGPKLMGNLVRRKDIDDEYNFVHYILKTGANWKGPIKSFKLTIVKRAPDDKVSTCITDTKRVSPTRFQVVRHDFTPTEDLKLVFFSKTPPP